MYTVYTQKLCNYCTMAKELIKENYQEYDEVRIDIDQEAKEFVKSFATTVPQIFYEKKYIGGYEELVKHFTDKQGHF